MNFRILMDNAREDKLKICRLKVGEKVVQCFDCGDYDLNNLILESHYANAFKQIYVLTCKLNNIDIGYLGFSISSIKHHEINDGYYDNQYDAGVVYLNFIAIDIQNQHRGYGQELLKYFINKIKKMSKGMPIRFLLLDSLPEKVDWYKKIGFKRIVDNGDKMYFSLI